AHIEKELLVKVFACERFHQCTHGRDTTVESDHKPLEAITNKPLACAPPRLKRMLHGDSSILPRYPNDYVTVPISDCGKSPAQLLMSKRLRFILYATHRSLQPALVNPEVTHRRFKKKQKKQRRYYDRYSKIRSCISVGAHVLLRKTGEVTSLPSSPRKRTRHDITTFRRRTMRLYRRTSRHLDKQDTLQRRHASHRHTQSPAAQSPRCAETTHDVCDGYIKRDVPGSTRRTTCDGHPSSAYCVIHTIIMTWQ
ncbi:hypothetical protein LSAT2_012009, partial [Lamellibrachia satsuma]